MRASRFYDLVSGRSRGVLPTLARFALLLLEGPYRIAVGVRNTWYDADPDRVRRVDVPVVSVGNLSLGGTGKTPIVRWIARRLRERGVRVAVVSRGYGATDSGPNDEALELEQSLPDVPHVQNADRVAAATMAVEELATQAIVLDDGFQHRRLGRDLDLVLLDATAPYGYGHVFPRGTLREPLGGVSRADIVCLTRVNLIDLPTREAIRERLVALAPDAVWCEAITRPTRLLVADADGVTSEAADAGAAAELDGRRVVAFCAIGNPAAFGKTLETLGAEVVQTVEFADHHAYTRDDIDRLGQAAAAAGAELLVCTHKDLVKVGVPAIGATPVRAVAIDVEFLAGEANLLAKLDAIAERALAAPDPKADDYASDP